MKHNKVQPKDPNEASSSIDKHLQCKPCPCPVTPSRRRNLLILMNPFSGQGKASSIYKNYVCPRLLLDKSIILNPFVTRSTGDAASFISTTQINFDGIVIISGDGLVYEVINGILSREDGFNVIRNIPLGIVPGGSGNGLAFSILHATHPVISSKIKDKKAKKVNPIQQSLDNIIALKQVPLDIIKIETESKTYFSFLSIGWGLLADMDIESEHLRFLGGFRFSVWGVIRSLGLRRYRGRLSYLPAVSSVVQEVEAGVEAGETTDEKVNEKGGINFVEDKIPSLDQEIPSSWTVIDDHFVMVYSGHVSHMASNCFFAPDSRLDDGVIWLLFLKGDISRWDVVRFLTSLESGKHNSLSYVHMVPVKAFRLEPLDPHVKGVMTVDGELIVSEKIQATVLPSLARIMSR